MRIILSIGWLSVVALGACHSRSAGSGSTPADGGSSAPRRGERVVIEAVAAEFVEARVLSIDAESARVQLSPSGENKTVEIDDVYRIRPPTRAPGVGEDMICLLPGGWVGCKVEARHDNRFSVVSIAGARAELDLEHLLAPTPVTVLNLDKSFARAKDRSDFEQGLAKASRPLAPRGWKPAPLERVLVRRGNGWYSGKIHELGKKEIEVVWPDSERLSGVAPRDIVPLPPYQTPLRRGQYALARPASPASAWQGVRVESAEDAGITVRDAAGEKRDVSNLDLVPLGD
jgi:hypothetical protein